MKRIIIYGMGRLFCKHQKEIDWDEIVAITDKKIDCKQSSYEIPCISPQEITRYTFDYIAVFSDNFFEEIKREIIENYFVSEKKVISWRALLSDIPPTDAQILEYYKRMIKEFQYHKILDVGMPLFSKYFFTIEEVFSDDSIRMDGIGEKRPLIGKNLYYKVFKDIQDNDENYEVALLWDETSGITEKLKCVKDRSRFALFHVLGIKGKLDEIKRIDDSLESYPVKKRLAMSDVIFWLVDLNPETILEDIHIYVIMHKKYQVQCNEMYRPICVGNTYRNAEYLSENAGDNISYLNEKINECTAMYWIWKNTDSKYVGINHYRRYFYNNRVYNCGNYLDKENVHKFLERYDIILANTFPMFERNELEQIRESMDSDICRKALESVRNAILRNQPDYLNEFDYVVYGHNAYLCHMLVTRREIFDQYCEWLFSFLIEAAENFDIKGYGMYEKRAVGFWAERLLTTWLLKQDLKIKELPYVIT